MINQYLESLPLHEGESEPRYNLFAWQDKQRGFTMAYFPREEHRPACYTATRGEQLLVSPGALDMAGLLVTPRKEDFDRISNVYIDLQNLAEELHLDIIWTAHHITREGKKHRTTKYDENDISGSIAIVRNAQFIMGLNCTGQEENDNILRVEIVVQRDGLPSGRALFKCDVERQRCIEFTKEQRKQYDELYGAKLDEQFKKKDNPDADSKKRERTTGDI